MGASSSTEETQYSNQAEVPVITKRSIGKMIVKYCGNEGQKDDETLVVTLRRLLQETITKLDTETEETWRNAEIVVYDQQGNDFCIRSGNAVNKFVVQLDGKDKVTITCTQREKRSVAAYFSSFITSRIYLRSAEANESDTTETTARVDGSQDE